MVEPGYRRYLSDFGSGFAPLVEGSIQIGATHYAHALVPTSSTMFALAATAGFGGEARFGDHFAVDARVFARLSRSRSSGGQLPIFYTADAGIGTSAGLTLRF
jgi:hypothetical protein